MALGRGRYRDHPLTPRERVALRMVALRATPTAFGSRTDRYRDRVRCFKK